MTWLTLFWANIIAPHWLDFIIIIIAVIALIFGVKKLGMQVLLKKAKYLAQLGMKRVEIWFKSEAGQLKMNECIKWVREESAIIAFFFSEEQLRKIAEEEFLKLKDYINALDGASSSPAQ